MRIAFYSSTILEYGGGLERYFIDTAKAIASYYPDYQVDIITNDERYSARLNILMSIYFMKNPRKSNFHKENADQISQQLGPKATYFKVKSFKELRDTLNRYDVVYAKNEIVEAGILKFIIGYKNIPSVIFCCATTLFYPEASSLQARIHNILYSGWIYRALTSGVKGFHAKNSSDEKILKSNFKNILIAKIPNSISADSFKVLNTTQFDNLTEGSSYNVAWVGRLTEQKGLPRLTNIIAKVNKSYEAKFRWIIAGDGEEVGDVYKLKNQWSNVRYLGHIKNELIPALLTKCNLLVSTSKWESYGLNILEAQLVGLPVVAYDIPGPRDIIDAQTGILARSDDEMVHAILEIYRGDREYHDIASYTAEKFDKKQSVQKLVELFKSANSHQIAKEV